MKCPQTPPVEGACASRLAQLLSRPCNSNMCPPGSAARRGNHFPWTRPGNLLGDVTLMTPDHIKVAAGSLFLPSLGKHSIITFGHILSRVVWGGGKLDFCSSSWLWFLQANGRLCSAAGSFQAVSPLVAGRDTQPAPTMAPHKRRVHGGSREKTREEVSYCNSFFSLHL